MRKRSWSAVGVDSSHGTPCPVVDPPPRVEVLPPAGAEGPHEEGADR
jgi:hypothetical protein